MSDDYTPTLALTSYYPNRSTNRPARLWSVEKSTHDLGALGLLSFFEGPGPNPMALTGASTAKLWLDVDAGVTSSSGTLKAYTGSGASTDEANWIAVTPGRFLLHLGQYTPVDDASSVMFATRAAVAAATIGGSVVFVRTAGYTTAGDLGGALYKRVGSEPSHLGKVQSLDGAWWEIAEPMTTPQMFGATGDGTTNDTAAMSSALNYGGRLYIPSGTYSVTDIDVSAVVDVMCSSGAIIKRRSAVSGSSDTIAFVTGSEGSSWTGGTFDGNRGSLTYASGTWSECRIAADDLTLRSVKCKEAADTGFYAFIANSTTIYRLNVTDLTATNCTANQFINIKDSSLTGLRSITPSNGTRAVDVRGWSFNTVSDSIIDRVTVDGMTGDTAVPSSTDTVTGILCLDLDNTWVGSMVVRDCTGDIDHLPISVVRAYGCTFDYLEAVGFAGNGIELIDCDYSSVQDWMADSRYQTTTSFATDLTSVGMIVHGTAFYPLGSRTRRAVSSRSENLVIGPGLAQRCAVGVMSRASGVIYDGITVRACRSQGVRHVDTTETSSFSNVANIVPRNVTYRNCVSEFNEGAGLHLRIGSASIVGGRYANNGQDTTITAASRSGIGYLTGGSGTLERVTIQVPPIVEDTQTNTYSDAATFSPGNAAQTWTHNANYYVYQITLINPDMFVLGQQITLKDGGGAGTDRTGYIIDMNRDEATVKFSSAISLSATGNTTALTGTWSSSETTLTGSGGAALTEVNGPFWLTNGTEWRQAIAVTGDNTITISSAFTTPFSGTTLSKLSVDVAEVPSQAYGIWFNSSNVSRVDSVGFLGSGNTTSDVLYNASTTRNGLRDLTASRLSAQYLTIADDAAASITPVVTSGTLIVSDGVNTSAVLVFRATASPLMELVASSPLGSTAVVEVTTGVLTGTTGTDVRLTVSSHTDGKIYIENRRGASRNITVALVAGHY